jgi:hypothetical protein
MTDAPDFPWGERNPEGGYKVGDLVGIVHSDHADYLFDNPEGVITAMKEDEDAWEDDEGEASNMFATVTVEVTVSTHKLYLISRPHLCTCPHCGNQHRSQP